MDKVRYLDYTPRHFKDFEMLAYKAIFERGFVDVDFNKQHWNIHLKNLVSLSNNIIRLLYDADTLVGFYIIQLHTLPWNHRTQALFQLMHIQPDYRNSKIYNAMFRDADIICQNNNVDKIQTTDNAIQMDEGQKLTLFKQHNFHHIDAVWEAKKDV